jgi:hypothetical protein
MALTFDLNLPPQTVIEFGQSVTFQNFVGQFQKLCPQILYIVDGTILRHYDPDDLTAIPKHIRFEYKQGHDTFTEYYFRDIYTNQLYCVFNRTIAKTWYPRLDTVDPPEGSPEIMIPIPMPKSNPISNPIMSLNQPLSAKSIPTMPTKPMSGTSRTSTTPVTPIYSGIVTIIDRGKKMAFPYNNYPVVITTCKYGD